MPPLRITIFTAAPIPIGNEVLVEVFSLPDGSSVPRVRDVVTSILYAGTRGGTDWTRAEPPPDAKPKYTLRGRVVECVVANVRVYDFESPGYAPQTSLSIEVLSDPGPYR
ncbi:MAG: hypothetical protein KIT84_44065 [Labilithrix sp.]|nr:hypothetical protein [Labilithrix sp.]MCW5818055.1 hypothetical protein [Labilithrix sp.]